MVATIQTTTFTRKVNALPTTAYRAFTEAPALREWFCDVAQINARPGSYLFLAWNSGYHVTGMFSELEKDRRITLVWRGKDEPSETQVTATFEGQDGGTLISVAHDGGTEHIQWDEALENLQSVLETGIDLRFARRPMLGIYLDELDEKKAADLGVPVTEGIILEGVAESMGAALAGLQKNDVLVSMDGKPINQYASLTVAMKGKRGGDVVEVVYYRGGERRTVQMQLSKRPMPDIPADSNALADKVEAYYAQMEAELHAVFEGVTEAEATHRPAPREWSAKETVAHLVGTERWLHEWIGGLIRGEEILAFSANVFERSAALGAIYPTNTAMLEEFSRSRQETVELIRMLPDEFVNTRRGSYFRAGLTILSYDTHDRDHFNQMREAIAAARAN
jgi:uncharacterized protein YndB with AHSA1/START domain